MKLQGQQVLITGGGSGIGLSLARALQARGNQVLICGRDEDRLAAAARTAPGVKWVRCDLTRDEELLSLVTHLRGTGGLSLLVNNAGLQRSGSFGTGPSEPMLDEVQREVQTNLTAPVKLTALCLPLLRAHPARGAVLNLTSGLGFWPKRSAPVYCATKAGLHLFSRALRDQWADQPGYPRVFEAVLPLVDTEMTRGRGRPRLKLSPERVVDEMLAGLVQDRFEMHIGGVKALMLLNRLAPRLPARLLRNGL